MKKGLILENVSNKYNVKLEDGSNIICDARGKFKNDNISPVVGDVVELNVDENVIEKIEKRKNFLKRPRIANLTQVIYVISAKHPKPDFLMLDKMLAYSQYLKINSVIVINKIDLDKKKEYLKYKEIYEKVGYRVIELSALECEKNSESTISKLKDVLKNNVSIFSGNSGVGKSSILNLIFEGNYQKAGDISNKNKRGKNTTTSVKLFEIDEKSYIADSPGFSTFDILEIDYLMLDKYFKEFNKIQCDYSNCTHQKEEECKIKKALKNNEISTLRYENYCKIYQQLKDAQNKW